ncbi:RsbR, positive regulator of sigma-B [Minicystis rosea]|nr:RsbR, positive regulator of sigma-B [Minicystis rosea]
MAENLSAEKLLWMLDRVPGAVFSTRVDLTTGKTEWLYFNAKMGEAYGLSEADVRDDPMVLLGRMVEEDRVVLEQLLAECYQTLKPLRWSGRIHHTSGELRWIETVALFERGADGTVETVGHQVDVTEQKRVEAALAASESAGKKAEALHRRVLDTLPVGLMVMEPSGAFPIYNPAARRYAGRAREEHGGDLSHAFGVFETDGITPFPNERLPLVRALGGEEAPQAEMILRNGDLVSDTWIQVTGAPVRDEAGHVIAGMVAFQDVTEQRKLEKELRMRNEQLAQSEEAKTGLVQRLRYAVDELSNPILEVWEGVLAMPIIGVVDSRRTADMVQRLLAEVARTQASFVIVDLTGVEIVDTKTADHLMKLMRKVEIVGARAVLTGIRPAVAETLVDIGVDLGSVTTLRNLRHGLREALRHAKRERAGLASLASLGAEETTTDAR